MKDSIGKPERVTQNRIVQLFDEELGYHYLGDWQYRTDNSNIEEKELSKYLLAQEYNKLQISKVIHKLRQEANQHNRSLYENNKSVYALLRYGVSVKTDVGENYETVKLIDWEHPLNNNFAIAEEVTIYGKREKRPDIVIYVNGIAIGVIELKNSRVSISEGIRQSIVNQKPEFIGAFFSTIQFIFAGNDTEGLKYGTIGTPEKFFLNWKEDEEDNSRYKLDKYLLKMCDKERLIDLMYNFVLFDGGAKKLPRVHQYFGIKEAQKYVQRREGGIIWHTQGSGKSIVMVMLAKWILENNPHARVAIVTDRDELDKQIEGVFQEAGEKIARTSSGRDLMRQLAEPAPRLLCSLVHKFGQRNVDDFEGFIKALEAQPSKTVGELFVFVDECHRTQSGKLHRTMKAIMPNAVFIGFTGTPLLKKEQVVIITARVSVQEDKDPKFIAQDVFTIEQAKIHFARGLFISLSPECMDEETLNTLEDIFLAHSGDVPLYFRVAASDGKSYLVRSRRYRLKTSEAVVRQIQEMLGQDRIQVSL